MLGVAALAACATPAPSPVAGPAVRAAPPPDQIDGRYRGIARLTRADGSGCPRSGNRIVTVEGSALTIPYRAASSTTSLAANVSSDGGIHGSDGRGSVEGQISGRHMDLTVSSDRCEVRYALDHM